MLNAWQLLFKRTKSKQKQSNKEDSERKNEKKELSGKESVNVQKEIINQG